MSKRTSVKKFPSTEVQGEGSFVVVTGIKVKEIREMRKRSKEEEDFDDFEGGVEMLAKHVISWNWVDDEGNPLPLPKDKPDAVDELTSEESEFLVGLLMGTAKN